MADQTKTRRDALGYFFFILHLVILTFITLGWIIPLRGVLIFYLVFGPATILHWKLNEDACVLNNLESWLRYRRWRAPDRNPEEGAWLRTLIGSMTGVMFSKARMDLVIYGAMTLFWALAWLHLLQFQGS
jgi:hypothetical protein